MEAKQRTEQAVHVSIASVDLVHDEHLATEPEEAHRLVPDRKDGEEGLVDRPHTDVGQECFLAIVGQPVRALPGGCLLARVEASFDPVLFLHRQRHAACTVGEHERSSGTFGEEPPIHLLHPSVHRIGGGHGGQGQVDTVGRTLLHQTVSQGERSLGLPAAGYLLDDEQLRVLRKLDILCEPLQSR